jgi:ABC-type nitrate/sulfonate/bicarbonate transport system substrate-binding protein
MRTSRSKPAKVAAAAAVVAAVCAASACSSSSSSGGSGSSSAAQAPSSVTYGEVGTPGEVPAVDFGTSNYFSAIEKKYNTTINVQYYTSPTVAFAALEAGQIQFLDASPATLMLTQSKGQGSDLVTLASIAQGGEGVFVAPIASKSKGTGIAAVKNYGVGTTWGVPSIGGVGQFYVDLALKSQGIDYTKVTQVSLGAGTVAAVESGRVGITTAGVTQAFPIVDQNKAYLVWFTSGEEAYQKFGYIPADAMMSTNSFIKQYPALTQALVGSELHSVAFFQKNVNSPQTVYNALSSKAKQAITEAQFVAVWPFVRAVSVPTTGVLSQQTMDHYANLLKQYGFLPSSYTPPSALANTSLVTGAYKSLGQTAPTSPINPKYTSVMNDSRIALG